MGDHDYRRLGYSYDDVVDFNHFIEGRVSSGLPTSTCSYAGDFTLYKKAFPALYGAWRRGVIVGRTKIRLGIK